MGDLAAASGSEESDDAPFGSTGPYHCVILGPGALDTKSGPITDARSRVLDHPHRPIAGLFGDGNCVASRAGDAYYDTGATVGAALTFGVIAGAAAAARAPQVPRFA